MKLRVDISIVFMTICVFFNVRQTDGQKGRKRDMMEDIQKTVNQLSTSVDRMDQRFSTFDSSLSLMSNRVEKIIDSVEHNKLNNKYLDEKLDRLDVKIRTIEESINTKISFITENVETIANDVKRIDSETDVKLRKMMNIMSDTYEMSKEVTILLKGRSGGGYIGNGDNEESDPIQEVQKKLLEQMSVMETSIVQQLSNVIKIGKETMTSLDTVNLEMLNIRDECVTKRQTTQQSDKRDVSFGSLFPNTKSSRDSSHSSQCPTLNITVLKQEIESQYESISVQIENEMTIIGSKIQEYMTACNTKTDNNNNTPINNPINGRSIPPLSGIPPIIINSSSTVSQIYTPSRNSIPPVDRSTAVRAGCQHSSELLAPKNCAELRRSGADCDGVYVVYVSNFRPLRVYCDMNDNGGGWTVRFISVRYM